MDALSVCDLYVEKGWTIPTLAYPPIREEDEGTKNNMFGHVGTNTHTHTGLSPTVRILPRPNIQTCPDENRRVRYIGDARLDMRQRG